MNILEEIISYKHREIAERKKEWSIKELEKSPFFKREGISLKNSLSIGSKTGIIAEFKRKSPSKGWINEKAKVEKVTKGYTEAGASGLSILTDEKFFGGSVLDIRDARKNEIPILRKDFLVDEFQVIVSKSFGADIVLLIAACLPVKRTMELAKLSRNLGMEVLLEIHEEKEMDHISDQVDIIGINNRDLKTFEINLDTSKWLIKKLPVDRPVISESGINTAADILSLRQSGFKGFLIGEKFMKEEDPGQAFKDFLDTKK